MLNQEFPLLRWKPVKPFFVRELPSKSSKEYRIVGVLGSGSTGIVYLAVCGLYRKPRSLSKRKLGWAKSVQNGPKWQAIKMFRDDFEGRAECDIQPDLGHPNIVKPYRAFIFEKKTYVVYELCTKGSLRHLVQACGPIPETRARKVIVQLLGGIKYIHSKGIVHRDIKLENIFLDAGGNVKIGDFSHAAYSEQSNPAKTIYGTLGYMAPESFNSEQRGCEVDIWSIGCSIYYLLGGNPPFYASGCQASCCTISGCGSISDVRVHDDEIKDKICAYNYSWPDGIFSNAAKGLVRKLLVSPGSRPMPDDIVDDDFFTDDELGTQNLHRETCRLAGIWRDETGNFFPCVSTGGVLSSFWASPF